jgi:DNA-binding NtrC family response regulator
MGHFVMACSSVAEARVVLSRQRVRLLVADEALFGHGRELADLAWSLGVPTLLMSAYEEIKAELEFGSRDFIGKPFRSGELSDHVNRVLAKGDCAVSVG